MCHPPNVKTIAALSSGAYGSAQHHMMHYDADDRNRCKLYSKTLFSVYSDNHGFLRRLVGDHRWEVSHKHCLCVSSVKLLVGCDNTRTYLG